jgi:hypothetical protein
MNLDDSYTRILERTPLMPADEQAAVAAHYARTRDPRDAQRLVLGTSGSWSSWRARSGRIEAT